MKSQKAKSNLRTMPPLIDRGALDEGAFHGMISLERKRTERSGKPFLLVLLDMQTGLASENKGRVLPKIFAALAQSSRDTDVIGWYKQNSTIGVMFTEIKLDDRGSILSTVMSKTTESLRNHLTAEQFSSILVTYHLFPEEWDHDIPERPSNPTLYPDLSKRQDGNKLFCAIKRLMDVVGSLIALIIFSPLFAIIAVAIKATSKGPVFFRQKRIGQHGIPFTFLKFRSMYVDSDPKIHKEYVTQLIAGQAERKPSRHSTQGVYKLTRDARITRVGGFLRRSSLDELPQFLHVLQGKMSLVGPRPPIAYEVDAYDIWHRRRVLEAKPGITGLWQVNGRSKVKFDDMVRLDLQYAISWSPWMDIKILLRTPVAVLFGDGAH